jgi:hypothetical protein
MHVRDAFFNDALLLRPDGTVSNSTKARLVPFGNARPFGEYLPFLRRFAPRPEVAPGLTIEPLAFMRVLGLVRLSASKVAFRNQRGAFARRERRPSSFSPMMSGFAAQTRHGNTP